MVMGRDNRLQGIVTAWDLAVEFTELVDPFKRIGEIEERLRTLVGRRLKKDKEYLEQLTMGGLQKLLEDEGNWDKINPPVDRVEFIDAFDEVRGFRNRLMHFRDPLKPHELTNLTNFCEMVREVPL